VDEGYKVKYIINNEEKIVFTKSVALFTGGLHKKKEIYFKNENNFDRLIAYGISNDIDVAKYEKKILQLLVMERMQLKI
jgi:hypothetical protein